MESTSGGYRPLDRGRGLQRISFRPFGPQFGLQIREGGGGGSPGSTTEDDCRAFCSPYYNTNKSHYLKKHKSMHIEFVSALPIFQGQKRNEF